MVMVLQNLIDKQDSSERIRDRIVEILQSEVENQVNLANAEGRDPLDWFIRPFSERSNPWDIFKTGVAGNQAPVVNVWFDGFTNADGSSDAVGRVNKVRGTFNVDCYGYGISKDEVSGGHQAGDKDAVTEVMRCARLVRNILMASINTYLQFQDPVTGKMDPTVGVSFRSVESGQAFQLPTEDLNDAKNIASMRLVFRVDYLEESPQFEGIELEIVTAATELAGQEFNYA